MQETILNKIIKDKIDWIKERKKKQPLNNFYNQINTKTRSFYNSLKNTRPFFILECKKKSPSLGILRKKFNLVKIANIYKKYASSVSVLTDEKYFHGNLKFINIIRQCVAQPILCKDFFIDSYQIYLARYYNADAILLMLSILNDTQYIELSKIAQKLNMGILTEINNFSELKRAIHLKASIIGINNRNLHDLSIDLNRTRTLAPLIKKKIIISESGIQKNYQVKELSKIVDGFLVGSSLMSQKNLDLAVKSLIVGENKICGLTRIIDSKVAEKCNAVYGGLIFVNNSPRKIDQKTAKKIIFQNHLKYVGVFQNESINIIVNIAEQLSLYAVQLHGFENQNYINSLRKKLPHNIKIWKVFSIKSKLPILDWNHVDKYIFDSNFGGSGLTFNWSLLKNKILDNVIIAGGINTKNYIIASQFYCAGLDLNSGIEKFPGIKDHKKMEYIFQNLMIK
ncbi:bifunctional indole-3-glycerol-phosphate synthase TrpC/phosphoribosylanthranilate isomerase TrpF [Buchnera aphidicola (Melanaphis sacchari)]|uniref:Multifunctional fusion protein n=1 Tax=Buchnera aphidicola (Melanaphis sacchari) TaxID=2173854 RepID=A0A2U8DFC9_9GAMM|nr:bifunctional indole-3-glycerol-phosphate synthase TrpC/phosphoribosylanthranilate isomerase TrpF [Buchnera aphidicola]AWH90508.1 bifunctional indole-3-glycerol-phosphate synthase TrpC/phosphoribosylanthranilate isomerase TrpF [Buchnera aphidicola (Melanaphis sacchari)]